MNEFLAMGGFGAFVWPAYGVAALAVGGMALTAWRRKARATARERDSA